MKSNSNWQRPVELSPDALEPSKEQPATADYAEAREIPLEMAQDVAETRIDEQPAPRNTPRRRGPIWLISGLLALLTTAVGAELYRLISWSSDLHPLLGIGLGVLTLLLIGLVALELRRGLKGSRQLKQVQQMQHQARVLLDQRSHGNSSQLIRQLGQFYNHTPLNSELQQALQQLDSSYNDREIMLYLNRHALNQADEAAHKCVQRYSVESGVLVAFSPWASFDMLLVAWRNLRMLREIATIYGLAPGLLTQGRLLKQLLQNLAFAGASELAMEAGSALLSSSLTAGLSARAGQGLGAGLFTARTGLTAIKLCRPLPDEQQNRGMLSNIAKGIVQRLTARA